MRNIHKKTYLLVFVAALLSLNSCYLDDDIVDYGTGPNLVGFDDSSLVLSAEANGDEYSMGIPVRLMGPSVYEMTETVTVQFAVDPNSTAEEGVHYRLESNSVEINTEGGQDVYEVSIPITVLTEGIEAPLEVNPVLNLTITDVASNTNVVVNEKTEEAAVTIAYSCPSNLNVAFDWEASGGDLTETLTGSDALIRVEGSAIQYVYESGFFDFGYYCNQYESADPGCGAGAAGSLVLQDQCGELSLLGADQYGDGWTISNVVVNGSELSFTWESDFGETSNVTLTRTDGGDWPAQLY